MAELTVAKLQNDLQAAGDPWTMAQNASEWMKLPRDEKKKRLGVRFPVDPAHPNPFDPARPADYLYSPNIFRLRMRKARGSYRDPYRLLARRSGFRRYAAPATPTGGLGAHRAYLEQFDIAMLTAAKNFLNTALPNKVDWREQNGVTDVRDQGNCGSCVAFGSTAVLESMALIDAAGSQPLDLAEAELFACGGGSCADGWYPDAAMEYLKSSGIGPEANNPYDPNTADKNCKPSDEASRTKAQDVVSADGDNRKQHIAGVGPMTLCFAVYEDFFGTGADVYKHLSGELLGYHCVEVIGYDDTLGCWICKNSWGPDFADQGFFKIAYEPAAGCEIDAVPFYGITAAVVPGGP